MGAQIGVSSKREAEILTDAVKVLKELVNPKRIILFGSRGKGNFSHASDFDLAVDATVPDLKIQQKISAWMEAVSGLYRIDLVYLSNVKESFRRLILKTGKTIYER